jgi:sugar/nucleoside kinase (ribokinase family)
MAKGRIDVVGIGNAIVDVLSHSDISLLTRHSLTKGAMTLLDERKAETMYRDMAGGVEVSGGSAANTAAALAGLGSRAAFIGKVRDDKLGEVFTHDIRSVGVRFDTPPAADGPSTARCLIVVTPDAKRTMGTYLGACVELGPGDIDEEVIAKAGITYLEGYLWDSPSAKAALVKAAEIAHANDKRVSLTLSDPLCVERHRAEFREFVLDHIDILFANEAEIKSLYEISDFSEAMEEVRPKCEIAVLTRSGKGSMITVGDDTYQIAAQPVSKLVDTTGAGDLYAAGFLHGLVQDWDPELCGRAGAICATEVLSHLGARPESHLGTLLDEKLG